MTDEFRTQFPVSPQTGRLNRERRAHEELVLWGQVLLQGAKGTEPHGGESEPILGKARWTAKDEERAWQVNMAVIQLDPLRRIILQSFYRDRSAEVWDLLEPMKRSKTLDDISREANYRWREYCRTEGLARPAGINGTFMDGLRQTAIALLVPVLAR